MPTVTVSQALALALQHHQAGRLGEAEALYRQILTVQPDHAEALHFLGVAAHQTGRHDLAAERIRQALALDPNNAAAHSNLGEACRSMGWLDEAVTHYRRALQLQPDHPEMHNNLGIALAGQGHLDEAVAAYRRALALRPDYPEAHYNLGNTLRDQGQLDDAVAAFRRALQFKPDFAMAHNNLGNALKDQGQLDEAVAAFRHALRLQPDCAIAHNNLGNALMDQGQLNTASAAFRLALELKPDYAQAHFNLGNTLRERGRLEEAITTFRRALELQPDYTGVHNNLAGALAEQGQIDEAMAVYRRAIDLIPTDASLLSNLIYGMHLGPAYDGHSIHEEEMRWNRLHVAPLRHLWKPHTNTRDPSRRLKIGYVSPDFRSHSAAFFLAPLLEAHDHQRHEIHCYASVRRPDAVTRRLQKSADVWRDVRALSDTQLAECVRDDGIDILVDLSMHTADNRLPVFARKPAPVQVSWLAYPGSTGMEAIDYRLTDAHIDPVGEEDARGGGQAVRLPDVWCCYAPIETFPLAVPPRAAQKGTVTFGSLNQFRKIHEGLLHCWATLLERVPGSRLVMVCPEGQVRERTHGLFATHGVARERVELVAPGPWADYVRLLGRIDMALDSFPCNGMTTTCHALWMGVPVVTLEGTAAVSRAGRSLLHTIGLPECVSRSEEEYIRIAAEWAGDLPRLAELRRTLRARMQASPLMDAPHFARNMEAAYRAMWQTWCAQQSSRR